MVQATMAAAGRRSWMYGQTPSGMNWVHSGLPGTAPPPRSRGQVPPAACPRLHSLLVVVGAPDGRAAAAPLDE